MSAGEEPDDKMKLYYEDIIQKMNVLSKSQSAFLKGFVHKKLSNGVAIVEKTLEILSKNASNDQSLKELKAQLSKLGLQEIEVDVQSAQIPLQDLLDKLRLSVKKDTANILGEDSFMSSPSAKGNNNNSSSSSSSGGASDPHLMEKLQSLEVENHNYKNSLELMRSELEAAKKKGPHDSSRTKSLVEENEELKSKLLAFQSMPTPPSNSFLPPAGPSAGDEKAIAKLQSSLESQTAALDQASAKISTLENTINSLKRESASKDELLSTLNSSQGNESKQLTEAMQKNVALKTDISEKDHKLSELTKANQQFKEKIASLSKEIADLTKSFEDKITEIQNKNEEEKESIVNASVEEIEEAEMLKAEEIANINAENARVIEALKASNEAAVNDLQKRLDSLNSSHSSEKADFSRQVAALTSTNSTLQSEVGNFKQSLAAAAEESSQAKLKLSSVLKAQETLSRSVGKVQSAYRGLASGQQALLSSTKKDLGDFRIVLTDICKSILGRVRIASDDLKISAERYKKEMAARKKLHNELQELKGNIRVFVRCRPPNKKELEEFGEKSICVSFPEENTITVFNDKNREKSWTEFDQVFDGNSTQDQVYKDVADLVVSVLDGYNVCIFAYGQTGSGKTWTMSGPPNDRGVNLRSLNDIFEKAQERGSDWTTTISVSILEVYNEEIRDLLVDASAQEKLEIRLNPQGQPHVPRLSSINVNNLNNVLELMAKADQSRTQASTNMNEHSSRSHMILSVNISSENRITKAVARGKLNLVDLAGSERISKSGATGQALTEAQNINKSLSALGDVIAARGQNQTHVPFRNSTLTYLLQESLSKDSKTLMICCTSSLLYNAEETYCSLNFAQRVGQVVLGRASKNVTKADGTPAAAGGGAKTGKK